MSTAHVTIRARFDASPDHVFAALASTDAMSKWSGARVEIVDGPRDGSVGALRRAHLGPLRIDERIVAFEPPRRLVYRIERGLPVAYHKGEVVVVPSGAGTEVEWNIDMASLVPGLARTALALVRPVLERGLARLRRTL